ncbi:MAG: metal-dependent hydrolase [Candidatus Paceibacterota bacterium]|jgi:membrane-bound metal-dependent hydrolase YbcI (DUF457 family)
MVLPGHLSGGFIASTAILSILQPALSPGEMNTILFIGTLAGDFPDIDLIRLYFAEKRPHDSNHKNANHREYITHTPIAWLTISAIIFLIGTIFDSAFTQCLALVILAGSWSHLLFDSIEYGTMWFWPLTNKRIKLFERMPVAHITARPGSFASHWQYVKGAYLKTWTFWAEIVVTIVAVVVFYKTVL